MLFAGVQSSDHSFASTGIATAAFLGWPHAAVVTHLAYSPGAKSAVFRRELEGGLLQEGEIQCPAVLTLQLGINNPHNPTLPRIKSAVAVGAADVGEAGSLSRVRRMYVPDKGRAQLIDGDAAQQAARLAEIIREFKGAAP
jgi:electron transfer flavoprotein beta subunit